MRLHAPFAARHALRDHECVSQSMLVLHVCTPARALEVGHSRLVLGQLASDSHSIILPQESEFYGRQMIPDKDGEVVP